MGDERTDQSKQVGMFDGFQAIEGDRPIRVWIKLDAPDGEFSRQVGKRFPITDLMRERFDKLRSLLPVELTLPSYPV